MPEQFIVHIDRRSGASCPAGGARSGKGSRRKYGRRYQEGLRSDLGVVIDLSAGGMRVLAGRVPKGDFEVCIKSSEGDVTVKARIAWSKRRGLTKRELGLEFLEVEEPVRRKLTSISSAHRVSQYAST